MNLPFFIARRYFLSRRHKSFINIISILSMFGVAIATAALIIVLSVFNGLGLLLRSINTSFDPELKIELVKGKSFNVPDEFISSIQSIDGVKTVTKVIEDYAYVRYRDADMVVTIKGVSENFLDQHRLDGHITEGELKLKKDGIPFAIIGRGIRYTLSAEVTDEMHALQVFYVKSFKGATVDPSKLYVQKNIRPGSVFSIEKNYDENYVFVPFEFAQELLSYDNRATSLELQTDGTDVLKVQNALQQKLGERFSVLTNEEQHKDIYRLLKIEKLFTFLAFALLLMVVSINIFFSLMMLAIDKKKDISILSAVGARAQTIRKIFLAEGALISCIGAGAGLVLGAVICYLQDRVGLVGMGMENAIVPNYPVEMKLSDFILTGSLIVVVSLALSFRPAILASQSYSIDHL